VHFKIYISTVFSCPCARTAIAEDDEKDLKAQEFQVYVQKIDFFATFLIFQNIEEELLLFLRFFSKARNMECCMTAKMSCHHWETKITSLAKDIIVGLLITANILTDLKKISFCLTYILKLDARRL